MNGILNFPTGTPFSHVILIPFHHSQKQSSYRDVQCIHHLTFIKKENKNTAQPILWAKDISNLIHSFHPC